MKNLPVLIFLAFICLSLTVRADSTSKPSIQRPVDIYKSPTCGCCGEWVEHIKQAGFSTRVEHPKDLDELKKQLGIKPQWQACHTAVNQGYFFEGHIPADVMRQFLLEKPTGAIGLAVPGMPMGSPGMDVSGAYRPYDVLQINRDGSTRVFARVSKDKTTFFPSIN